MIAPGPEIFLFVDAQLVNCGTVKSNADQRIRGVSDDLISGHRLDDALSGCGEHAELASARKTPTRTMKRPIKTREVEEG